MPRHLSFRCWRLAKKPRSSLHVVPLIYFYEPDLQGPEALLNRYATIRPFAQALYEEGVKSYGGAKIPQQSRVLRCRNRFPFLRGLLPTRSAEMGDSPHVSFCGAGEFCGPERRVPGRSATVIPP